MSRARRMMHGAVTSLAMLAALAGRATADDAANAAPAAAPLAGSARRTALEPLVPELAGDPYRMTPGVRQFRERLSVSPGYGRFGSEELFTLRIAYNPGPSLGYEAAIGHNPGHSVHAVLHTFSAIVRRPFPGRFQPYLTAGYGMMIVFPGQSVNAAPVTKNTMTVGGGLEVYLRNDLALRAEMRSATVFGKQRDRDGVVAYDYLQQTIGLSFYRSIRP